MSTVSNEIDRKLQEQNQMSIEKYSINLMWINKTSALESEYINQSKSIIELVNTLLMPALKWAEANPAAEINIWYDSVYTTKQALKRTSEALVSIGKEEKYKNLTINFRDVREIPIVFENPDVFSDYLPVYFRIDILKAIIIVDEIERGGKDATIFSDLEVGNLRSKCDRMNKKELFGSVEDIAKYKNVGLTLNRSLAIENQFLQLMNNPKMLHAIKEAVINVNLTRAITALNFKPEPGEEWLKKDFIQGLARAVFPSIQQDVFRYYKALITGFQMTVRPDILGKGSVDDAWIPYNPEKDGYAPFGLFCCHRIGISVIDQQGNYLTLDDVCVLPKLNKGEIPYRIVDVRAGQDHYDWGIPTHRISISEDGIYRCKLWKDDGVKSNFQCRALSRLSDQLEVGKETKKHAEGEALIFSGPAEKYPVPAVKSQMPVAALSEEVSVVADSAVGVAVASEAQVPAPLITPS